MGSYSMLPDSINLSDYRHCGYERSASEIEEIEVVEWYRYICDGILVSMIGLIGIIGNICAVLVLRRPKLKDCFHQLLIGLAFFDTLYIICGGINYTFRAFEENVPLASANAYKITYPHLILPFLNIGLCGTIFMTVAISIERFLGICHPLHYPPHTRKSWFYIVPVTILSILVNIPKFLEAEVHWMDDVNAIEILEEQAATVNVTVGHIPKFIPIYRPTKLRLNEVYIEIYVMYFRIFFIAVIPLFLIIILNGWILYDIVTSKRRREVHRFGSKRKWRRELNLFIILLCIVVTFICCHTPRIITDIWEFSYNNERKTCTMLNKIDPHINFFSPFWILCLSHVAHAMGVLNSSVNFIIYSFVGHTFRKEFLLMIRCENRLRGEGSRRASGTDTYVNTQDTGGLCNSVQKKPVKPVQTSDVNSSKMLSDLEEKQKMLEIM